MRRILVTTWPSAIVAVAAWFAIVSHIDPAGSYPWMGDGPGLTIDEVFNVEQGVFLVEYARQLGWLNLAPGASLEVFESKKFYNPDHPPLGRYWLGGHHHAMWWWEPPLEPEGPFVTACARTGSATAFALTVWLVGAVAASIAGRATAVQVVPAEVTESLDQTIKTQKFQPRWEGLFASLALVLMPRVYGHAHLASLETITNLTCTAAVSAIVVLWSKPAAPSRISVIFAGILMGLALLSKIQAILIPLPVILWSLWRWRFRAIAPLLIWGIVALAVFYAGWPYLWIDPAKHFQEYLGRTTERMTIHCYYFGERYDDKQVPWHYPFVMFAATVPLCLHILGAIGLCCWNPFSQSGENDLGRAEEPGDLCRPAENVEISDGVWKKRLLLACLLSPLIVFSLPGVAVYDGERLFLTVFPLWAIFIGHGMQTLGEYITKRSGRWYAAFAALALLICYQVAWQRSVSPMYLSYYNELTFGTTGAERLGLELDYWGCSITRTFLSDVSESMPPNSRVAVMPTLHPSQAREYWRQSPILRRQNIKTVPANMPYDAIMVYRRRADVPDRQTGPVNFRASVIATSPPIRSLKGTSSIWLSFVARNSGSPTQSVILEDLRYP